MFGTSSIIKITRVEHLLSKLEANLGIEHHPLMKKHRWSASLMMHACDMK
jgi:hypothetical protein